MANSKKLIGYNGSMTTVSVPTAVSAQLVRQIATSTFASNISTVKIDTYANDISGAPWGAQNVVWLKEPICTISFNANGGSGTMEDDYTNVGMAYTIPQCAFTGASKALFETWAIDSVSGSTVSAGTQYAFPKSTELFAIWGEPLKWFDNDKATWAEANAEGWSGYNNLVNGFTSTVDPSSTYNIPKTINGMSITQINGLSKVSFVEIGGKGVSTILTYAFYANSSIQTVSFPTCKEIGQQAFYVCSKLSSVYFPECVKLNSGAFQFCYSLVDVNLPKCTYVGQDAFDRCSKLTTVSLPVCSEIGAGAFYNYDCFKLTNVYAPNCLKVGVGAFRYCYSLDNINMPKCSCLCSSAFENCTNLEHFSISNDCSFIGHWALYRTKISDLSLENCSFLGRYALGYTQITSVNAPLVTSLWGDTFIGCSKLSYISLPNCVSMSDGEFQQCAISYINLSLCSVIESNTFGDCKNLSLVDMPKCNFIGWAAFASCTNLTQASYPLCSYIGGFAFDCCTNLSYVSMPQCQSVDRCAFYGTAFVNNQFQSSRVARLVTNYENFAIGGSFTQASSTCTDNATTIVVGQAFQSCTNLTSIEMTSCKFVGEQAFQGCSSLAMISLPKCSLIGLNAFSRCTSLTSACLPECLSLSGGAFYYCSFSNIDLPKCKHVGSNAFTMNKFTSITLSTLEYMESYAFYYCQQLLTASFPKCSYIGGYAFGYCARLQDLYFMSTAVPTLQYGAFSSGYNCYVSSIYVRASLLSQYQTATNWSYYASKLIGI